MKILLIDDSRFVRLSVKKHLEKLNEDNLVIFEAACGEEGILLFEQENPELVFLDLLMPDLSGEEVLKQIKAKSESTFVVVLTSNVQKPVKKRLLSLGANLFVEKTITLEKITSIIESFNSQIQ